MTFEQVPGLEGNHAKVINTFYDITSLLKTFYVSLLPPEQK